MFGGTGLALNRLFGAAAQRQAFLIIFEQMHQHEGQLRQAYDAHRVAALEEPDNVPEIVGVISGYNGDPMLRRLDDVVAAAWNQTATNEGNISKGIERGQFSNGVHEKHAGC
jgi:hypothetical protein